MMPLFGSERVSHHSCPPRCTPIDVNHTRLDSQLGLPGHVVQVRFLTGQQHTIGHVSAGYVGFWRGCRQLCIGI